MNEMKFSPLVKELKERAVKLYTTNVAPFTAERFLIAAIDKLLEQSDESEEMDFLERLMKENISNFSETRHILRSYLISSKSVTYLDDLNMKNILTLSESAAKGLNSEITAPIIYLSILQRPTEPIAAALGLNKTTPKSSSENKAKASESKKSADSLPVTDDPFDDITDLDDFPTEKEKTTDDVKGDIEALVADVKRIREELKESVFGQDNAINTFATGYFQASLRSIIDKSVKRPKATFLFAGPPGVGKTFLAEQVAKSLNIPFKRFDMSEYADKEASIEFCGSDKVYKNGKVGNVTSFVAENPVCVLLFDEIEKSHLNVIHLFLQMLDAGRLRDNYSDEEVSFKDAIIIMTTNAGRSLYENNDMQDYSILSKKVILKALQSDINPVTGVPFFPAAICSRFASGNVVMFNHMGAHNLRDIAKGKILRNADNFSKKSGIALEIDEKVYTALLLAEGAAADARTVGSRAENFFNEELYELLRLIGSEKSNTNVRNIDKIRIGLDFSKTDSKITNLFSASEQTKILVFANDITVSECKQLAPSFDIIGANTVSDAVEIIKNDDIGFLLIDMEGELVDADSDLLNIEDKDSPARDFFRFLAEHENAIPMYLLEKGNFAFTDEEKVSFFRQGVRGVIRLQKSRNAFASELGQVADILHQQANLVSLTKENKLISFETAQKLSKNKKIAEIKLFDFKMTIAVDSEDAKNVMSNVSKPNIRFDDVIGANDAKKELKYFVEYLRNPKKYLGTGVKAPKGVLLYGPPGTGKTLLAKAMASEANVTFIASEGNQFLKKLVGEGPEKVHELFTTARKYAPAVLFIDEIDAIAKERKGLDSGNDDTLTAFLTEMDGFSSDPTRPVFVLAATNFEVEPGSPRSLDRALLRRFDRRIYLDLPDKEDRLRFMNMKIKKNPAFDISAEQLDSIALRSTGMSLAELDSAFELALRSAIRQDSTKVTDIILDEAFETFNSGEVKKWDESQLLRVARHEAGHAFICYQSGETPSYLTIVARGGHGGYMQHSIDEKKHLKTKADILSNIRTSLGGRAAELVYYGEQDGVSTGAGGDLVSATKSAYHMLCSYGMDDNFGLAVMESLGKINDEISKEIRKSVCDILDEQLKEAVRIISENKDKMDALVERLLIKNHLTAPEIEELLGSIDTL